MASVAPETSESADPSLRVGGLAVIAASNNKSVRSCLHGCERVSGKASQNAEAPVMGRSVNKHGVSVAGAERYSTAPRASGQSCSSPRGSTGSCRGSCGATRESTVGANGGVITDRLKKLMTSRVVDDVYSRMNQTRDLAKLGNKKRLLAKALLW